MRREKEKIVWKYHKKVDRFSFMVQCVEVIFLLLYEPHRIVYFILKEDERREREKEICLCGTNFTRQRGFNGLFKIEKLFLKSLFLYFVIINLGLGLYFHYQFLNAFIIKLQRLKCVRNCVCVCVFLCVGIFSGKGDG
jgi:hypothetical protein